MYSFRLQKDIAFTSLKTLLHHFSHCISDVNVANGSQLQNLNNAITVFYKQAYICTYSIVIHHQLSSFIIIINYARLSYLVAKLDDYSRAVADPEFRNGGRTVEGEGSGTASSPQKMNFYLKMVDFGAF